MPERKPDGGDTMIMNTSTNGSADRSRVNDFAFKMGTVNGTGSASANGLLMQAIFGWASRHGQEHLPVEHPGVADVV
jgi:hypothetical protein